MGDSTFAGFVPRPLPAGLEQRWLAEGLWVDETIGQLLDRGLSAHAAESFNVHSATRPATTTLGAVRERALRLAGTLRAAGIGPGDAVAFQLPNCVEAAVTFYGVAFAGAAVVPIVHFYGTKEVAYILRRTPVRAFVTIDAFGRTDFLAGLDRLAAELATVDIVAVAGADAGGHTPFAEVESGEPLDAPVAADPASPALVAYTSGTTAEPKGVVHSHRTLGAEVRQMVDESDPTAPPNLVGAPVGHAIGMLGALLAPVVQGRPVHLLDAWDPTAVLRIMTEHQVAAGSGATFFLQSLLDHPDLTPEHRALMRCTGLGGAAVPAAVAEQARDLGIRIVRKYGSTEHPSITGAVHTDPEDKRLYTDGHPSAGVEMRLVDLDGRDVEPGTPGEILSRGPDCCIGYTDPALTAAAFDDDGWFHTEDIGVVDEDGWLRITDRKKDIIIRGGENVSAAEVEEVLVRMPGIVEAVVVAGPDARLGERVCCFLRPEPGADVPTLEAVRAAMAEAGLGRQKWPEEVHPGDDLPRTPSGKVQKAVLRRRLRTPAADPALDPGAGPRQ
ncbi:MAG TPA: AMP-binding protein [Acidimicrobiales bacterium]|nr:AMP-binding protein [Acidimicrobiales bacterium]